MTMLDQFVKSSITGWGTTQVCASLLSVFQKETSFISQVECISSHFCVTPGVSLIKDVMQWTRE